MTYARSLDPFAAAPVADPCEHCGRPGGRSSLGGGRLCAECEAAFFPGLRHFLAAGRDPAVLLLILADRAARAPDEAFAIAPDSCALCAHTAREHGSYWREHHRGDHRYVAPNDAQRLARMHTRRLLRGLTIPEPATGARAGTEGETA